MYCSDGMFACTPFTQPPDTTLTSVGQVGVALSLDAVGGRCTQQRRVRGCWCLTGEAGRLCTRGSMSPRLLRRRAAGGLRRGRRGQASGWGPRRGSRRGGGGGDACGGGGGGGTGGCGSGANGCAPHSGWSGSSGGSGSRGAGRSCCCGCFGPNYTEERIKTSNTGLGTHSPA